MMNAQIPDISFDNTYARELEGFYVPWKGDSFPNTKLLRLNFELAEDLGLDLGAADENALSEIFSGKTPPNGASPLAMAYAGHQFGGFSPQLGDGRAILLGEVVDKNGRRKDIHLKGSGRTPFSRGGDGKAVLGPVLREYLMGEAMHALGIPTTRALAAVTTGETIERDGPKQGAVLARIAASHIRVGTFQYFAARREVDKIKQLADYAIARHYPDLRDDSNRYVGFLDAVAKNQSELIAAWVSVGFVHGVMNTDNMTISGETIDYGPCAFIDSYDANAVFSSIDQGGRYAYGNQPNIAQWNLARLAETLLHLINPDDTDDAIRQATNVINGFAARYQMAWLQRIRAKLGLQTQNDDDLKLANDLFEALQGADIDFTNFFRSLGAFTQGARDTTLDLIKGDKDMLNWLGRFETRSQSEPTPPQERAEQMNRVNPIYIPRNHMVEAALEAADNGEMAAFDTLFDVLKSPYVERAELSHYADPAPSGFGPYTTYCGT